MQKLMNVQEVAELLGVEKTTIYSWTFKKFIPHLKISEKCIKFDLDKIKEWLAEKQFNPSEPVAKEPVAGKKRGRGRPKEKHGPSLVELAKKDLQVR